MCGYKYVKKGAELSNLVERTRCRSEVERLHGCIIKAFSSKYEEVFYANIKMI